MTKALNNPDPSSRIVVDLKFLRECYEPNFKTGKLSWKERPRKHFDSVGDWRRWNALFGGKAIKTTNGCGYRQTQLTINGETRNLRVHRIIWALAHGGFPNSDLDHKNGVKINNRLTNLRLCTQSQNSYNSRRIPKTKSGVRGVTITKSGTYNAKITQYGVVYNLGTYKTLAEAKRVHKKAFKDIAGEFANFAN